MFSRNSQPASSSTTPASQVFQEDVEDLLAENLVSAQRTSRLLDKATKAGIKGINPKLRKTKGRNQARDAFKSKLKWSKWPGYYWFKCRLRDRRTGKEFTADIPINLPIEILEVLWELGSADALLSEANLDTAGKKHMEFMRTSLGEAQLLGWGMHGDGIPCNYDRTESVIMISLNLPGLAGRNGRMRIPLVILPDHAVSQNTFDDINEVIAWQMRHLLIGSRPTCRHDGQAWKGSDLKRARKTGSLPFKACVVQVRADWDWMGKCFHLPFHNVKEGCCWLCRCKRSQVNKVIAWAYIQLHEVSLIDGVSQHFCESLVHQTFFCDLVYQNLMHQTFF